MNKGQKRGVATVANEQRIDKRNNISYYWKCTKDRKEEMKMYKCLKRRVIVVVANEQRI
jgi:hypothetical protein